MSIGHYFYRKRGALATLLVTGLVVSAAFAQSSRKKDKGPRALAVIELPADAKSGARLIPVAIMVNGRFWDAAAYMADPRPLALEPGNVYEVERSGEPVGFFQISDARQANDEWIGLGKWEPRSAKQAGKESEPAKTSKTAVAADEDRPVLHKSPASRPQSETRASAETDRERLADDPNRPLLRRGKPPSPPEDTSIPAGAAERAAPAPAPATPFKAAEVLPAISDAGGPEPHGYTFEPTPAEQLKLKKDAMDLADAELGHYLKRVPALRYVPAGQFDQVVLRVFDLQSDNYPEVVLTARIPGRAAPGASAREAKAGPPSSGDFYFYVTVVGQTDLYDKMRKLFTAVTDTQHLDTSPRLELVDAVDAEGTGRGNLLFRAYYGDSTNYQLYHVGPDSLRKLFDSGGSY